MNPRVAELVSVLTAQRDALAAMVSLLEEQEGAITRADAPGVERLMTRQEPVLRDVLRLEQRRRALMQDLATELGLDARRPSLSALVARLPGASASLADLGTEMRRLLQVLDTRNRHNTVLLDRAVSCLEGLVRAIMSIGAAPAPVYAASGRPAHQGAPARLVDKSA
jgi:flagellar biosynthesis/type III secretory pathway chaperone